MSEDVAYTPMCIGARNPFVYAEHKLNEKIKWDNMRPGQKRKKLEDAFGMPYNYGIKSHMGSQSRSPGQFVHHKYPGI
jgi:hypothetical protein